MQCNQCLDCLQEKSGPTYEQMRAKQHTVHFMHSDHFFKCKSVKKREKPAINKI